MVWGVTPVICDYVERLDDLSERVAGLLLARGFAQPGDMVVMTGGHPITARGQTNFVKVLQL
jgi:pyruvate kinase